MRCSAVSCARLTPPERSDTIATSVDSIETRRARANPIVVVLLALVIAFALGALWLATRAADEVDVATPHAVVENASAPATTALDDPPSAEARVRTPPTDETPPRTSATPTLRSSGADVLAQRVRANVRVSLVDVHGQPLHALQGTLAIEPDNWRSELFGPRPPARSVEIPFGGEHVFEALPVGSWVVKCTAARFATGSTPAVLRVGESELRVAVRMPAQRVVQVALRDTTGKPFVAVLQSTRPHDADRLRAEVHGAAGTGASFVPYRMVKSTPRNDALWRSLAVESHEALTITVHVGEVEIARGNLAAGSEDIELVASLDDLAHAAGALIVEVVDDIGGGPLAGVTVYIESAAEQHLTDASGRARFEALSPDTVSVIVAAPGRLTEMQKVSVGARSETALRVRLSRGVKISGTLRFVGAAQPKTEIAIASFSSKELFQEVAKIKGSRFEFLEPPGEYVIAVDTAFPEGGPDHLPAEWRGGRTPVGVVYVDAREGDVTNLVLVVPEAAKKR